MAKQEFKAESKKLMDLMINSIYTHKEIFLREIISNASDAIDKLSYKSLTDDRIDIDRDDYRIRIILEPDSRMLTVSDNGIGMTYDELEKNLGTIARSGSGEFKADLEVPQGESIDIIGQFGVGFYSAFMVADNVIVETRGYGENKAYRWESTGADGFTISECEKKTVGTDVIMHLKPDSEDEDYSEFLQSYRIRSIIKKYSDYISWPIVMDTENTVPFETDEKDEQGNAKIEYKTVTEEETVNSMVPIWQRSKAEVTDEECAAYYRDKYFEGDPIKVIRISAEGTVSYKAMLFIPEKAPYDFYTREFKPGIALYSNGVMIMEHCTDIIPDFFRFVRGVVDSPDLSLNLSREVLQHNRQLKVIANNIEKKVKAELLKLLGEQRDKYETFYESFGMQLKYGVVADYGANKDALTDLLMFTSCKDGKPVTLSEYAGAMPESQQYIYYACAESADKVRAMPQSEQVLASGCDILCFNQDVDEFAARSLVSFEDKQFRNISSGDLGLESSETEEDNAEKESEYHELLEFMKEHLKDKVSDVKLSHNLKTHPVCLSTQGDISLEMERYFASLPEGGGTSAVKAQRVLELNGSHKAMSALSDAFAVDKEKAGQLSEILLDLALLSAGLDIDDTAHYTELICRLF